MSKSYVYISVYGENFAPEEFSKLINLTPTDMGIKCKKINSGATLKECIWNYYFHETNALERLETQLNKLLYLFDDKVSVINNFINTNNLTIKCYIVIKAKNDEDTGISLNNEIINLLNKLNATIDVYTYNI